MRVAYFAHDVTDATVRKRVRMLRAAGAETAVVGFRRSEAPVATIDGASVYDLGRTHDARLAQRAAQTLRWTWRSRRFRALLDHCDVIVARNLEMLLIADAARRACGRALPIAYECLDIHRLMLSARTAGRALRAVERRLLDDTSLLLTSSPAFVERYFRPAQRWNGQTLLLENKALELEPPTVEPPPERAAGPPWRIGWFGVLRCRRSLEVLGALAAARPDLVEVVVRGRPTAELEPALLAAAARSPALRYEGAYDPSEIDALYASTHFTWAIDWYDAGGNSDWLLPNRLYEGGGSASVPVALKASEAGRWLRSRGLGVTLADPDHDLEPLLQAMNGRAWRRLERRLIQADRSLFRADRTECERLGRALESLRSVDQASCPTPVPTPSAVPSSSCPA